MRRRYTLALLSILTITLLLVAAPTTYANALYDDDGENRECTTTRSDRGEVTR